MLVRNCSLILFGLLAVLTLSPAVRSQEPGQDRHAGYYYPEPGGREIYNARPERTPEANRPLRVGFVTGMAAMMAKRAYAPSYVLFAKGGEAEKLIIVALRDGPLDTLFRARAVLADLTALARTMPIFGEYGARDRYTFFDLAKILGFTQITISDGRGFAHQVAIE
jgi:hypothetical protein